MDQVIQLKDKADVTSKTRHAPHASWEQFVWRKRIDVGSVI